MFTVAMTAWNRPEYLRRTLDSLTVQSEFANCDFVCNIEPSDRVSEIAELLESIRPKTARCTYNHHKHGILLNNYLTIHNAFAHTDSEVVLLMQDDSLLSPDALKLVKWYAELPERDNYVALWLHNYKSNPDFHNMVIPSRGDAAIAVRKDGCRFHGEMWALSRTNWEAIWKGNWRLFKNAPHPSYTGSHSLWMHEHPEARALVPHLSRGTHIGKYGGGCNPGFHDRVYGDKEINEIEPHSGDSFVLGPEVAGI